MKKNYLLLAGFALWGLAGHSQILNESAGWPNTNWNIAGTYLTGANIFESNPKTTANFAYDDNEAGSGHHDEIAAESPVIDLTAAFNGGETFLQVTVEYGFHLLNNDRLRFEYWNAATSAWVAWGENIPGNNDAIQNNFCDIPKTVFQTPSLDISGFTTTQLTGFKYRISYNDDPNGTGWNWGFCFNSPVLKSLSCAAPEDLAVSAYSSTGATISWSSTATNFQYVIDSNAANPAVTGTAVTGNSYVATGLLPATNYYFHILTVCTGGNSSWVTIPFTTYSSPPANDNCSGSVSLTVNPGTACTASTNGTLAGATDSGLAAQNNYGTADDDVWFSFVATSTTSGVELSDVTGEPTDLVLEVFSGSCGTLTSISTSEDGATVFTGLTVGDTYYVRVYSFGEEPGSMTNFTLCVTTQPSPPSNDNCANAFQLTTGAAFNDDAVTGTTVAAITDTSISDDYCQGNREDDVWYTATVPASGNLTIETAEVSGSNLHDTVLLAFTGTCGNLDNVDCDDDDGAGNFSKIQLTEQTPGSTIYIAVYRYSSNDDGQFKVSAYDPTPVVAPANDNCSGAIALTVNPTPECADTTAGTLAGATNSNVGDDDTIGTPNDDVWFGFEATATSQIISIGNVSGEPTDIVNEVFSGDCGALTSIYANDDNTGIVSGLTVGDVYYIRVYSYGTQPGATTTFTVCVSTPAPAPANDDCSGAIELTVNPTNECTTTTEGTLAGATDSDVDVSDFLGTADDDVWFSFVAMSTSQVVSVGDVTGNPDDLVNEVFSGDCGELTSIYANDDNSGLVSGLTVGNTYYVRVYSYTSNSISSTNFTVCVAAPPTPPANDDCSGAIVLTVNPTDECATTTAGTLVGATDSGVNNDDTEGYPDDDVWFSFVAGSTSQIVSIDDVAGDPDFLVNEVFSGECGELTSIYSSDNDSGIVSGLTVGNTYYVRVYSYTDNSLSTTTFNVCVATPPPAPANDDCSGAIALTVGGLFDDNAITGTTTSATTTDGFDPSCQTNREDDVWYTVIVPASGSLTVTTAAAEGSDLDDTVMTVYSGTCGDLTEVPDGCSDDIGDGNYFSSVDLEDLTPGETLYVGVWRYGNADNGQFMVSAYDASLSAQSFNSHGFNYYPNPVKDVLNIQSKNDISNVTVFNLLGQQVMEQKASSTAVLVNMSSLPKATYVVKVTSQDAVETMKVIKE